MSSHSNLFHCLTILDLKAIFLIAGPDSSRCLQSFSVCGPTLPRSSWDFYEMSVGLGLSSMFKSCHFHS